MGDLTCAEPNCLSRSLGKPTHMTSAYGGKYRCALCSKLYLAAGGQEYSDRQLEIFKRIDNIDRRPKE